MNVMLPRIDGSTKVIVLGITGRAGRQHSKIMREYGTNIVGGVSPKSEVKDVDGVPVFADSASAVREHRGGGLRGDGRRDAIACGNQGCRRRSV